MGPSSPRHLRRPKHTPTAPQQVGSGKPPRKRPRLVAILVVVTVVTGLTMVSAGAVGLGTGRVPAFEIGRAHV